MVIEIMGGAVEEEAESDGRQGEAILRAQTGTKKET